MKLTVKTNEYGERIETDSGAPVAKSSDQSGIVLIGGVAFSREALKSLLPFLERWVQTGSFEVK